MKFQRQNKLQIYILKAEVMSKKTYLRNRINNLIAPVTPRVVRLFVDEKLYREITVPQGVCSLRMRIGQPQPEGGADMLFLIELDQPGITEKRCNCQSDADALTEMLLPGSPWLVMKT